MIEKAKLAGGVKRNVRRELVAMMRDDLVMPAAVAREAGVSEDAVLEYANGARKSADFVLKIVTFIDDRRYVSGVVDSGDAEVRELFALRFISNAQFLLNRLPHENIADRSGIVDQIQMYLQDLRRVVEMMAVSQGHSPERLASMLRSMLGPGDRLLISRAGGGDHGPNKKQALKNAPDEGANRQ